MSEPEFRDLAGCMFREYLLTKERSEVVARLREHQAKGHVVVLVSAQLYPSLKRLGDHYGADGVVGTKVESIDGRYTWGLSNISAREDDPNTQHRVIAVLAGVRF